MYTFCEKQLQSDKLSPFEIQGTNLCLSRRLRIFLLIILKCFNCAETSLHLKQFMFMFIFVCQ